MDVSLDDGGLAHAQLADDEYLEEVLGLGRAQAVTRGRGAVTHGLCNRFC